MTVYSVPSEQSTNSAMSPQLNVLSNILYDTDPSTAIGGATGPGTAEGVGKGVVLMILTIVASKFKQGSTVSVGVYVLQYNLV